MEGRLHREKLAGLMGLLGRACVLGVDLCWSGRGPLLVVVVLEAGSVIDGRGLVSVVLRRRNVQESARALRRVSPVVVVEQELLMSSRVRGSPDLDQRSVSAAAPGLV